MVSTFTWLDYAEQDRQRMLDVIDLLREHDTRDELGNGAIRDALAELLFPGVNTIQTRARYFLFIPWLYLDLERRSVPSRDIAAHARAAEVALIDPLKQMGEDGVFGRDAGARLQRLPSSVYWYGLGRWGIRVYDGAQADYHRWLDRYYRDLQSRRENEEPERVPRNWHTSLPNPPSDFPRGITFALSSIEAEYLRERVLTAAPQSALAFLVDHPQNVVAVSNVWEHPLYSQMPSQLVEQIDHARDFSVTIHGAALLYNLMLAEHAENRSRIEQYREGLRSWGAALDQHRPKLLTSKRRAFWRIVLNANPYVPTPARSFVDAWLDSLCSIQHASAVADSQPARDLIADRERRLKGGQARLHNRRALEMWNGAAGTGQLNYRWPNVQTILNDIYLGLGQESSRA